MSSTADSSLARDTVWRSVLARVQERLGASPTYKTLFESSRLISLSDGQALIEVPNGFMLDRLRKQQHDQLLATVLEAVVEAPIAVDFVAAIPDRAFAELPLFAGEQPMDPASTPDDEAASLAAPTPVTPVVGILNPKYTFTTFVTGAHSEFTVSAAKAIADNPGKTYNPLFIYGGVGLGKTHLMHAIAHHLLATHPGIKVAYLSSETFVNEMINAIRDERMPMFQRRYRSIDLLLIDDIQFIGGKERMQEEFFHTFNALHETGKQIVMTSDCPPKEIAKLEARLRSRFEWGLITDIQRPDLETRIAILRKKAELDAIAVPDEVLDYIAAAYPNNVRELEGALIRVMAYASLNKIELSVSLAERALGALQPVRQVSVPVINEMVAEYYHLAIADLEGSRRTKDISHARQVAMYLVRQLTGLSLSIIGSKYGNRDHTTVMHAIDKVKGQLGNDVTLTADIQKLTLKLKG